MQQEIEIIWLQLKDGDWTNHMKRHTVKVWLQLKNVGSFEATFLPADHPLYTKTCNLIT